MHLLRDVLGHSYGGSSGTNLVACLQLAQAMQARGERGSIVSLLCDRGERYGETLYCPTWCEKNNLVIEPALTMLHAITGSARSES
jgi:cysteine synthase A